MLKNKKKGDFIMEQNLIFIGYHDFEGKEQKHYYVLDFITEPKISEDKKREGG